MTDSNRAPLNADEDGFFSANVRAGREALGLSQAEMAAELKLAGVDGFHPTTVSRIEKGLRKVGLREAHGFARVLDTTVERLCLPDDRYGELHQLQWAVKDYEDALTELRRSLERADDAQAFLWRSMKRMSAWFTARAADERASFAVGDTLRDLINRAERLYKRSLEDYVEMHLRDVRGERDE